MPLWFMLFLPFYSLAFMVLVVIPISGDWSWFEGWAYAIAFAVNTAISYAIINRKNPRALRNRMKLKKEGVSQSTRKSAASDWLIYPLMSIGFFGLIMLPGLAHRLGWPGFSFPLEMVGLLLANIGYTIINIAILQNSFAVQGAGHQPGASAGGHGALRACPPPALRRRDPHDHGKPDRVGFLVVANPGCHYQRDVDIAHKVRRGNADKWDGWLCRLP